MPRETVPYHPTDGEPFKALVTWRKDADMQLGLEVADSHDGQHSLVDALFGDAPTATAIGRLLLDKLREDWALTLQIPPVDFKTADEEAEFFAAVGRTVLDAVTGSQRDYLGIWWTPDRYQINALIRLLRKGRDEAFGRDE